MPRDERVRLNPMKTLILYPRAIKRAEAYQQAGPGEMWGPLWPFLPRDKAEPGYRDPELMKIPTGETFEAYVRKLAPGRVLETPTLGAGEYYPRIWRTGVDVERYGEAFPRVEDTPFRESFVNSLEQIEGLFDDLLSIFRVVHPAANNLGAYGGTIRDIIILACTEVEAQWKGVLEANGVTPSNRHFKTPDYVKLLPVMKLDQYEVELIRYPGISGTGPFDTWNATEPTKSLSWYDAYNQVKHDREAKFEEASLKHAIEAVAACIVMLAAQFGVEALQRHHLKPVFEFRHHPGWEPKDWYYQPAPDRAWEHVHCPM
jgi:hypothetical protein